MRNSGLLGRADIHRLDLRRLIVPAALLLPGAAMAQATDSDAYLAEARRKLTIDRPCPPQGEGEEIVVCGRRIEAERYRLPIREGGFDPKGEMESVSRQRNKLFEEGDAGIGSCSTVGPGGWTGCGAREFKRRLEQEGK